VTWRDDDDYTVVDFDDTAADTRTVVVTMTVADGTGAITPGDSPISFRVLVPSLADPDRFAASMADSAGSRWCSTGTPATSTAHPGDHS
jgi:hypothetical protein